MGMHIVIAGNVVDGLEFFGPFKTSEHAVEWAAKYVREGEWTIAPLHEPVEEE